MVMDKVFELELTVLDPPLGLPLSRTDNQDRL